MTPGQLTAAAAAKSLQSCPTLCDPIDGSSPGSPVPGILQARTLEWVAISFSSAWKWKVKVKLLSHVRLLATPWTAAFQAPPPMGFSRQEYWSGVPLPSLGEQYGGSLKKLRTVTIWSRNPIPEHIYREHHNLKRYMHSSVHCSTVYKSQDMEATSTSTDRGIEKEDVVHIHSGILLSHKKDWNNAICSDFVDEHRKYLCVISQMKSNITHHLYVKPKKWTQINLFTKHKQNHRLR